MKVSPHFFRSEFACKCGCGFDSCDKILIETLEDIRSHFNSSIKITSGNRCESHNKSVGGADGSFHKIGMAADFVVKGVKTKEVYDYLDEKYPNWFGIGLYSGWVHLDSRATPARW